MLLHLGRLTPLLTRSADKAGAFGSLVSALGCPMCFPALAGIGAAVGLGFLAQWEGLFVNFLLPAFAWIGLAANALGWLAHRQWHRSLAGMLGPSLVLLSLYPWWTYAFSTWTLYGGLALMLIVAIWDLVAPGHRRCPSAPTERRGQSDATTAADSRPRAESFEATSILTCPICGIAHRETMPTNACQFYYECPACKGLLRPLPGDCCVFCSYGDVPCPPKQVTHHAAPPSRARPGLEAAAPCPTRRARP